MTVIVHLMASPFFGGPERQMLGLAQSLPGDYRSVFLSFAERGLCRPFLDEVRRHGFEGVELIYNAPCCLAAVKEITGHLRRVKADVLCCSGYKPDLIGWRAARRAGVPVVSVSHGWTGATLKVRLNEALDRLVLHGMDAVVCVSQRQAARVRRAGVPLKKIHVIRNAIHTEPFALPGDSSARDWLHALFPRPPRQLVGAVGRLSPEKGFGILIEAAAQVNRNKPDIGFVVFGDGPLRNDLARRIGAYDLTDRFVLAGFRGDLERILPWLDLAVLPSFTEGLPVAVLEAFAAGVPVVATAVGGTPEVVEDGKSGYLVPPGDAATLARRMLDALADESRRQALADHGRRRVRSEFTFAAQSERYQRLFKELTIRRGVRRLGPSPVDLLPVEPRPLADAVYP